MGDYSFVKDQGGAVCGIWVKRPSDAQNQYYLLVLLMKHGHSTDGIMEGYRVVPNTVNSNGCCFVMFSSSLAPGELQSGKGSSEAKGGCFIATACYGSSECAAVVTLRRFRDERMVHSAFGRAFVAIYYWLSPPFARVLNRYETLRLLVRDRVVDPIVRNIEGE
jgi:hypothetical protein